MEFNDSANPSRPRSGNHSSTIREHGPRIISACGVLVAAWVSAAALAQDALLLPWSQRPPYFFLDSESRIAGSFHKQGERIFAQAGIAVRWVELPPNRFMYMLASNRQRLCLVGWLKSPERERMGRFSQAFFRDRPMNGVVAKDSPLKPGITLEELLAVPGLHVLIKQNFVYGPELDGLIAALPDERVIRTSAAIETLPLMIGAKRADITFMHQRQIHDTLATEPGLARAIRMLPLAGLSDTRWHILCSRQVTDEEMQRIDAAITDLPQ